MYLVSIPNRSGRAELEGLGEAVFADPPPDGVSADGDKPNLAWLPIFSGHRCQLADSDYSLCHHVSSQTSMVWSLNVSDIEGERQRGIYAVSPFIYAASLGIYSRLRIYSLRAQLRSSVVVSCCRVT